MPEKKDRDPDPWATAKEAGVYRKDSAPGGEASAAAKAQFGTTRGRDLGSKGSAGSSPMPKQSDYPGNNAGWSEAMRKWREKQAGQTQQRALASPAPKTP